MIFNRSGFFKPTLTSTSRPRLRKISSARGLNSSAMRTLGMGTSLSGLAQLRHASSEGPIEPGRQRLQITLLPGGATPDPQPRGCRPVRRRIDRDILLFQDRGQVLGELRLPGWRQRSDALVDNFQTDTGVRAGRLDGSQKVYPGGASDPVGQDFRVSVGACLQCRDASDALRPFEGIEIILGGQQRRRIDGRALEQLLVELALLGHAENLRQRPRRRVAFEASYR